MNAQQLHDYIGAILADIEQINGESEANETGEDIDWNDIC